MIREKIARDRLGWYIVMMKASSLALGRIYRGCFVCGLLPSESGLSKGVKCPSCGKRSENGY